MKKKAFFILYSLFAYFLTNAQESYTEKKFFFNNASRLFGAPLLNGYFVSLTVTEYNTVYHFIYNTKEKSFSDFSEEKNKESPVYAKRATILASISNSNNSRNIVYNEKTDKIFIEHIDFEKKISGIENEIQLKKEKFIGAGVSGNEFVFITHPNHSDLLRFYFITNKSVVAKEADLSFLEVNKEYTSISKELDASAVIDVNTANDPSEVTRNIKIFFAPDKIIILGNQRLRFTQTATLTIQDWKQVNRKIFFEKDEEDKDEAPVSNAFYFNNYLFMGAVFPKKMSISIIDFESEKLVQHYSADTKDSIAFKNTPIRQEGGGTVYAVNRDFEIENVKKFFKKIRNADLVLSIKNIPGAHVEMTVGSFKKIESNSSPGVRTPSGGINTSLFATSPQGPFSGYAYSWDKITYFKSVLDKYTFANIPDKNVSNAQEKSEAFMDRSRLLKFVPFRSISTEYIAYINGDSGQLIVSEFQNQ